MVSLLRLDATKGPWLSKSRRFHCTSDLSTIECSHGGYGTQKSRSQQRRCAMSTTNVWEMEPDTFFGSDMEEFKQEVTTTPLSQTGTTT